MIVDGISQTQITKEDMIMVNYFSSKIDKQLQTKGKVYSIVQAFEQQVNGINKFYYVVGQPGTEKATIQINIPPSAQETPNLLKVTQGW